MKQPLSGRKADGPNDTHSNSSTMGSSFSMAASKDSARAAMGSARGDKSARPESKSARSDVTGDMSSRSMNSARAAAGSMPSSRPGDAILDSGRNTMSTARVHTAIAALAAEKSMLEQRLQMIEAALEEEGGKRMKKTKSNRK